MTRQLIILLILCTLSLTAYSQQKATPEKIKYWIFLTDKLDASGKVTQVEAAHLTDQAVSRRALRGESQHAQRFIWQDAPISQVYENDLAENGFMIQQRSRWLNAVTLYLSKDEVGTVTKLPYVKEIRPMAHLIPQVLPNIPVSPVIHGVLTKNCTGSTIYGRSCTQLDIMNAIPVLEDNINGQGVTLGFLDTEFHYGDTEPFSHPVLRHIRDNDQFGEVRNFTERDSSNPCGAADDHGMSVASVAVGYLENQIIGPGWGATIYGASTECVGYERNIEEENFVVGVEWLESKGVDIITASLGYSTFDEGQRNYTPSDLDGDTGLTTIAMDLATLRGVVTVTSAGNYGPTRTSIVTPADGDSVIAVGGVTPFRGPWISSSRGPTADNRIKPDVSAQGSSVAFASSLTSIGRGNGTSFSSPMVAGVIAQILQVNPDLKPRDVWQLLISTASQATSPDNTLGYGIVNAHKAVQAAKDFSLNRSSEELPVPDRLIIHSPFPNPFNDIVHFTIESFEPIGYAQLKIYDVLGREVGTVYEGPIRPGGLPVQFDGFHLSPGIYAYTLEFEGRTQSGTIIRLSY